MTSLTELDHFVDRTDELASLAGLTKSSASRRTAVVVAPDGMGKETLLNRFQQACRDNQLRTVRINLAQVGADNGYLWIARQTWTDLEYQHFSKTREIILKYDDKLTRTSRESAGNSSQGVGSGQLKILFVSANPETQALLRADKEFQEIEDALEQGSLNYEVEPEFAAGYDDLIEELLKHRPNIVHLSVHGNKSGDLYFENKDGQEDRIKIEIFADLLSQFKDEVRCVVLNGCWTADRANIIAEKIPCVVGISNAIRDEAAIAFAKVFYTAIGSRNPVGRAVGVAVNELQRLFPEEKAAPQLTPPGPVTEKLILHEPTPEGFSDHIGRSTSFLVSKTVEDEITYIFEQELSALAIAAPFVFLLDNWHLASTGTQEWISNQLVKWIDDQKLGSNTCVVVTSVTAEQIGFPHTRIDLSGLPEAAIREYCAFNHVRDLSPGVWELIRPSPLNMRIIVNALKSTGSAVIASSLDGADFRTAFNILLDDPESPVDGAVAFAIRAAAVPRVCDEDLLIKMAPNAPELDQVKAYPRQWNALQTDTFKALGYHPHVRELLLNWWNQAERLDQFVSANQMARQHYQALANKQKDENKRYEHLRDTLYHWLIEDQSVGIRKLSEYFEDACSKYQFGRAQEFYEQAKQMELALNDHSRRWINYFAARLQLTHAPDSAADYIGPFKAKAETESDQTLKSAYEWTTAFLLSKSGSLWEAESQLDLSLQSLKASTGDSLMYDVRILIALGNCYRELAERCGGFPGDEIRFSGAGFRAFVWIQHLPFLLYKWVRNWAIFLPLYVGTNYQAWLIGHLLRQAAHYFNDAKRQLGAAGNPQLLSEVQLALAEIDHQIGLRIRARRLYDNLLVSETITSSGYREAKVRLGRGQLLYEIGRYQAAVADLSIAVGTLRDLDRRSFAEAAALLAKIGVETPLGAIHKSVDLYVESIEALEADADYIRQTQVIWELEDLFNLHDVPAESKHKAQVILDKYPDRYFIARFPNALLTVLRRGALIPALAVTYTVILLISLALVLAIAVLESIPKTSTNQPALLAGELSALLIFSLIMILISLWLYPAVYSGIGWILVVGYRRYRELRALLHSPKPRRIEEEEPDFFKINRSQIIKNPNTNREQKLDWSNIAVIAHIDHFGWRPRPVSMVSRTFLMPRDKAAGEPIDVSGITTGYERLKFAIQQQIKAQSNKATVNEQHYNFVIFRNVSVLVSVILALLCAWRLYDNEVFSLYVQPRSATPGDPAAAVGLPVSTFTSLFIFMLLIVFPTLTLWRLFRRRVRFRHMPLRLAAYPSWILFAAAFVLTVVILLSLVVSPQPVSPPP